VIVKVVAIVFTLLVIVGGFFVYRAFLRGPQQPSLYVINVLDKEWYDDGHIKGSINVPFEQLELWAKKRDRSVTHVVLYCSNYRCTASGLGARMLKNLGFEHVWAYEAGFAEWYAARLPIEGPCEAGYLKIANEKMDSFDQQVHTITTADLHEKMVAFGLIGSDVTAVS
jgi:rhodanese-related sulfurtransferase